MMSLTGFFAELAKRKNITSIYITLSHTKENAIAQVVFGGE